MELPVNHFKRAITSGKRPVGAWLSSGSPATAEALGFTGFDFLVVDTEHTPVDVPQMIEILRAAHHHPHVGVDGDPRIAVIEIGRDDLRRSADDAAGLAQTTAFLGGEGHFLLHRRVSHVADMAHRRREIVGPDEDRVHALDGGDRLEARECCQRLDLNNDA